MTFPDCDVLGRVIRLWHDLRAVRHHADARTFWAYMRYVVLSCADIIRTQTLVPADRRMKGRTCTFTPIQGDFVVLDGEHFSGAREMYCRRVYFRVPGFEIGPDDIVVDVGANRGLFTTMAAVYGHRVVAIEAQSSFVPVIQKNLERNRCLDRAVIEVALVGDPSGLLRTSEAQETDEVWRSRPALVDMTDILQRNGVDQVHLMKIDIEGSEFSLLSADADWLHGVDRIVMELHPRSGGDIEQLRRTLTDFGFSTVMTEAHTSHPVSKISGDGGYLFAAKTDRFSDCGARDDTGTIGSTTR